MLIPNAATLRTLVHHFYLLEPIDGSFNTVEAQQLLIDHKLAEVHSIVAAPARTKKKLLVLTPLGQAHVIQLLNLDLPKVVTKFVGANGKVIEV